MSSYKYIKHILFVSFILFVSISILFAEQKNSIHLIKINSDDSSVFYNPGSSVLLNIKAIDMNGNAVEGIPVSINKISFPENASEFSISKDTCYTNKQGIVKTQVILGSKTGEYILTARSSEVTGDMIIYKFNVQKQNWLFFLFIGLLGGLAIFLLGINRMGRGLQKTAGDRLRSILRSLTNNPLIAAGSGIFIAMILQSSGATAAMLVNFVNAGLMSFAQSIWVLFGAGIGATITAQLIAFKLTDYALLIIAVGTFGYFFVKNAFIKYLGETLLGIGLLFFGLYIMSESVTPLENYKPFVSILTQLNNPFLGILIGIVCTAMVQSSGAFIGILIILSIHRLIGIEAAIPLIFGANIGTTVSGLLATINTSREAHKVAISLTVIKILGVLIFVWWIPSFIKIIQYISNDETNSTLQTLATPRQIANAHTLFNIVIALIGLPFTKKIITLTDRLVPVKYYSDEQKFKLKFLDDALLSTPTLAIRVANQETLRMGVAIENMLKECMLPFTERNENIIKEIEYKEKKVQFLFNKINPYLISLSRENIPGKGLNEVFLIMYTIKEFLQIKNIISEKIVAQAKNWLESESDFSEEGKKELIRYYEITINQTHSAIEAFAELNVHEAKALKKKFEDCSALAREFELNHYIRLKNEIKESLETSTIHIELINMLKLINEHSANIVKFLLDEIKTEPDKEIKKSININLQ